MIHEHFRTTAAYEAVQGLSVLFNIPLQNDDVQNFDVRLDQALLSASDMPSDVILKGLYKSKLPDLLSVRLFYLCTIKKPFETMDRHVVYD